MLEGYLIALANLDDFIQIIRDSRDRDEAKAKLWRSRGRAAPSSRSASSSAAKRGSTDGQLRLHREAGRTHPRTAPLSTHRPRARKIKSEYDALLETIKDLLDILAKEARVLTIIKDELREIQREVRQRAPHADRARRRRDRHRGSHRERRRASSRSRTTASSSAPPSSAYRAQRRGGKGVIGMTTREGATEEDERFRRASLHRHHARLPDVLHRRRPLLRRARLRDSRRARARAKAAASRICSNCAPRKKSPRPSASRARRPTRKRGPTSCTSSSPRSSGIVKKTNLSEFKNIRKGGIIAIQIEAGRPPDRLQAHRPATTRSCSSPTTA